MLKQRYPNRAWSHQPLAIGRIALANISLAIAFGIAACFSPGGRVLGLFVDRALLQAMGAPKAHLIGVFANYWLLAIFVYLLLRIGRVERFIRSAVGPLRMLGIANLLLIAFIAARVFASTIEGGGASFVVGSFAVFVVYPAWALIAVGLTWLAVASAKGGGARPPWGRFTSAEMATLTSLILIPAYLGWQSFYGEEGPLRVAREARGVFEARCANAGERLVRTVTEEIQSIYLDPDGAPYYQGIVDGVYSAWGGGMVGEALVNTGWLLFIERKALARPGAEASAPYTRHHIRDGMGRPAYELQSRYGVFSKDLVPAEEKKRLGVEGKELRIVDLRSQEAIASTTFFVSARHRRFCGHAPDGTFQAGLFIQRALNLKQQYPAIPSVKPPGTR